MSFCSSNTLYYRNTGVEEIQLKNFVKTEGFFYRKERYAVLTNLRLLLFESENKFLKKGEPRVINFNIETIFT